ncbi:Fe-S-containing protein [Enterococcus faecalis]|uniref:Fe-S-containing protein n=1 Tax=Enterococcus faecalis TaxID=1351 RepID=UPI003CC6949D
MFESFILYIQTFLVLSSVLFCFYQLIQSKKLKKQTTISALLLSSLVILFVRIPNFFNKSEFLKLLSLVLILLICLFYLSFLLQNRSNKIKKYSLIGILVLTIVQASLKLYDTVSKISVYGHKLFEKSSVLEISGNLLGVLFILLWVIGLKKSVSTMLDKEKKFFSNLILIVFLFQQFGLGMLWLYQKTILLDGSPYIFQVISLLINQQLWSVYALLIVISFFCISLNKKKRTQPLYVDNMTAAERRKVIALDRKNRRALIFLVMMMFLVLLSTTILKRATTQEETLSEPEPYEIEGSDIIIPLSKVSDGDLHRYEYITESGIPIRFIVIQKSEGAYGVGLDACEICGASGYIQRGDTIVCKLCDVVMNKATIGFKGGCNPIPLAYDINKQKIIVHENDLSKHETTFK